jgi:hypothetical protein
VGESVKIEGLNKLVRDLRRLDPDVVKGLRLDHIEMAEKVASTARGFAPRRSGRLRSSVRSGANQRSGVVRAGKKAVPYAGPIHFGWASRPNRLKGWRGGPFGPQPFLYDAIDSRRDEISDAYLKTLRKAVESVR